jgi:hypothetical protein
MKTAPALASLLAAASVLPVLLPAQEALPALPPEELAARRQSVVNLEAHIAQREQRLAAIVADIRALDERVESGVEEIVTTVSGVRDSESSRVRIANAKADVMVGLKRTIEFYNTHRDALREQLRTGRSALPKETLEQDLAILDGRVDKRVLQIAEIAKSFPDPQELEKYESTAVAGWAGWWIINEEISDAWRQNRRDSRHTESAREGFTSAMNDAIEHLMQRNASLESKLKSRNLPETEREFYQWEIARNAAIIERRTEELQQFASGEATEAAPVMQGEAHELDMLVRSRRDDLREDFFAIFRKYSELNRARAELKQLEDNLAARKEWLARYDAQHPQ